MLRGCVLLDKRGKVPRWVLRFQDVDGRWKRESTAVSTRQLARRLLAERNDQVAQAKLMHLPSLEAFTDPRPPVTVGEFAKSYLSHVEANLKPGTAHGYQVEWRDHFEKELGHKNLRDITSADLQRFVDQRRRQGRAASTIRTGLALMSGMFREAMKAELIDRNPARLVKWPKPESTIIRWLTEEEEAALLEFAPEQLRSAILVALNSGLRDSEQRHLTHVDVSFERGYLTVRNTKSRKDRIVPLNEVLRKTLAELPRKIDSPYVFNSPRSKKVRPAFNDKCWRRTLKRAGINNLRWHDLRHTFASRLAQKGVALQVIKELLGHATMTMVLRYAHLKHQNLCDAVAALDPRKAEAQAAQ